MRILLFIFLLPLCLLLLQLICQQKRGSSHWVSLGTENSTAAKMLSDDPVHKSKDGRARIRIFFVQRAAPNYDNNKDSRTTMSSLSFLLTYYLLMKNKTKKNLKQQNMCNFHVNFCLKVTN